MYEIRQFNPTFYILLALGLTGFCYAVGSPVVWVGSMLVVGFNYWLLHSGRLRAMPGILSTLLMFGVVVVVGQRVVADPSQSIITVGQGLVLYQLLLLFGPRHSRTIGYLFILSLLLMVAGAISTEKLLFGIIFIVYIVLALYASLLFHLKNETELARRHVSLPAELARQQMKRSDYVELGRSMRLLTLLMAVVAIGSGVITFIFFPRGVGQGLLGQLNLKPAQALTGFSEQVSLGSVAQISQSREVVGYISITRDDKPVPAGGPLYLRGLTYEEYSGEGRGAGATAVRVVPWQWLRQTRESLANSILIQRNDTELADDAVPSNVQVLEEHIRLQPTMSRVLFVPPGLTRIRTDSVRDRELRATFYQSDQTIQLSEALNQPLSYTCTFNGVLDNGKATDPAPRRTSSISPQIQKFAIRPEVSGRDDAGKALLSQRDTQHYGSSPVDLRIAQAMSNYLRSNFTYTLDLTDTSRAPNTDPIVAFLYDYRRGHCEYFAGAMTLMLQSVGVPARLVTGFVCQEFNPMIGAAGSHVVRQSDAHAWVEVADPDQPGRWISFDPTSSREAGSGVRSDTLWQRARRLIDFFEFSWATSVVAYDRDTRDSVVSKVESAMVNTGINTQSRVWDIFSTFKSRDFSFISPGFVTALIGLMLVGAAGFVGYFIFERLKLRRKARRIGLDSLTSADQRRLARQLAFLDEFLLRLERAGIRRQSWQTAGEFARSLTFLPTASYESGLRLVKIYYKVRFGGRQLEPAQTKRLSRVVEGLDLPQTIPSNLQPGMR